MYCNKMSLAQDRTYQPTGQQKNVEVADKVILMNGISKFIKIVWTKDQLAEFSCSF